MADEVKALASFERHDFIDGDPKSNFDLAMCRKILIYAGADHKLPMLETVSNSA